ncbi:hypothetical protein DUI87_05242 [Hirundo rustica rustica]|uniref:Uncharacterized protein n=1 Tax=Hirundo rustica rustica TaxID=333673 RepID=A0A3M0KWG6_HIRRU|nr:hypothetical protein DUI87_05242 [Hirundo rustica rustica]
MSRPRCPPCLWFLEERGSRRRELCPSLLRIALAALGSGLCQRAVPGPDRVCSMVTVTSPHLTTTDFINNCGMDKENPAWCSQTRNVEALSSFSLGSSAEDEFQESGSDPCANAKKGIATGCVSVPGVGVAHPDSQPDTVACVDPEECTVGCSNIACTELVVELRADAQRAAGSDDRGDDGSAPVIPDSDFNSSSTLISTDIGRKLRAGDRELLLESRLKTRLDRTWSNLGYRKVSLPMAGGATK